MIIGNLVRDPDLKTTASGIAVCRFTVAVSRPFKKDETDFIPVVVWQALAENCGKYLSKGKKVAVSGRIQTGSYEDKDGIKRYTTDLIADDVEFLTPRGEREQDTDGHASANGTIDENNDFEPLDDDQMPY